MIASYHDGKELNSPNDVVVRSDSGIYFTILPTAASILRQSAALRAALRGV